RELEEKSRMLVHSVSIESLDQMQVRELARSAGARLTIITPDGTVLADSEADPSHMENHRDRPEIQEAFRGRTGSSTRTSPTIGTKFLYVAVPLNRGALRLAMPLSDVN